MVKNIQFIVVKRSRNKKTYLPFGGFCHSCFGLSLTLKEGICKHCYRQKMREKNKDDNVSGVWEW